jgi:uncharacterized protein (TIGR03083 family)
VSGSEERPVDDPVVELRFALAEADAVDAPDSLRDRVLRAAAAVRPPGRPTHPPPHIRGAVAFRRTVARFGALLDELAEPEWSAPALRDLDVQGLVGHLIGVEEAFVAGLTGRSDPARSDHVADTQAAARRQSGRPTALTRREWSDRAADSIAAVADRDPEETAHFFGLTLPLDAVLVVRAFELWTHDEDVRRATGRTLAAPDPECLARMVTLVTTLLPLAVEQAGRARPGTTVRLVLTGPAGGTWDVDLGGTGRPGPASARVVVDAAQFCRAVADRANTVTTGAVVSGDRDLVGDLFVGAAALALD